MIKNLITSHTEYSYHSRVSLNSDIHGGCHESLFAVRGTHTGKDYNPCEDPFQFRQDVGDHRSPIQGGGRVRLQCRIDSRFR